MEMLRITEDESGGTILEGLVSLLLLMIVLLPLVMIVADGRYSARNRQYAESIILARNKLETALANGNYEQESYGILTVSADTSRWQELLLVRVAVSRQGASHPIVEMEGLAPSYR